MKNTLSRFRRLRNLVPSSPAGQARTSYDRAMDQSNATWDRLDERAALYSNTRARLLTVLGAAEHRMADTYRAGYGLGWPDADEIVRVHEDAAELLHLLASTSAADNPWSRVKARSTWEEAFGTVLDELALANTQAPLYAELLARLWFATAQHVSAEVAEIVNRLIASIFRAADNTTNPRTTTAAA